MKAWVRSLIALTVALLSCGNVVLMSCKRGTETSGSVIVQEMTPEELDHQIRQNLPSGTDIQQVRQFLEARKIEFGYDEMSKTVYATARKMKGSTAAVRKSLVVRFHFDDALKLTSIQTEVGYTGP